jgi:predicted RNase H-like HicB family nuclease
MGVASYVGILDGSDDVWGVRIPDVPGCHGGGPTPEAALADAISALREVAAYYIDHDMPIPAARGMAEVIGDDEAEYDPTRESLVLVPLLLERRRPVKASISLDAGLLEAIDEEAKRRGLTRSAFLVGAAIDKIEGESGQGAPGREGSPASAYRASGFAESASTQDRLEGRRKAKRR